MQTCLYCDQPYTHEDGRFWCANAACPGNVGNPRALPRRGDVDKAEATVLPVFLLQRRRFVCTDMSALGWDSDRECLIDHDGQRVSEDDAIGRGLGQWEWDTMSVGFTREQVQQWVDAHHHRGRARVYAVPTMGALRDLLAQVTNYDADHPGHRHLDPISRKFSFDTCIKCGEPCNEIMLLSGEPSKLAALLHEWPASIADVDVHGRPLELAFGICESCDMGHMTLEPDTE